MSARRYYVLEDDLCTEQANTSYEQAYQCQVVKATDYESLERETRWAMEHIRDLGWRAERARAVEWLEQHPKPAAAAPDGA